MPALSRCPQCECRRELHWADPDRPDFGCYGCSACPLDYEETAALLDGTLGRSAVEAIVDGIDQAAQDLRDPNDPLAPAYVPGLQAAPGETLGSLDLKHAYDHITLMSGGAETPLGYMGLLVFRFGRSNSPSTADFREPIGFVIPNLENLERFEALLSVQLSNVRRVLEAHA